MDIPDNMDDLLHDHRGEQRDAAMGELGHVLEAYWDSLDFLPDSLKRDVFFDFCHMMHHRWGTGDEGYGD